MKKLKKIEEPKDIKLRMGTAEQRIWESVEKEARCLIEDHEKSLIIQKGILVLAETKVEMEKRKFEAMKPKV